MVDREVVDILAEIRERVVAAQVTAHPPSSSDVITTPQPNSIDTVPTRDDYAGLTVLARTWNRLPPLVSNRTGTAAKLELWIKARLKSAFRWFTWEQVNFNNATHQTFLQMIESQEASKQQMHNLQAELIQSLESLAQEMRAETRTIREQLNHYQARLDAQQAELLEQRSLLLGQRSDLNNTATRLSEIHSYVEKNFETKSRLDQFVAEVRERDERLLDEQRVCFKQLSLELSESQILQDRARRELESRVAKLDSKE